MKTILLILSGISMGLAVASIITNHIDRGTLLLVWSFYLKYSSDKRN